jgi:hypothetical protein
LDSSAFRLVDEEGEERPAVSEILRLERDFATQGQLLIRNYVKVCDLVDSVVKGLQKAGLVDLE